jgi:hypothetical protein
MFIVQMYIPFDDWSYNKNTGTSGTYVQHINIEQKIAVANQN